MRIDIEDLGVIWLICNGIVFVLMMIVGLIFTGKKAEKLILTFGVCFLAYNIFFLNQVGKEENIITKKNYTNTYEISKITNDLVYTKDNEFDIVYDLSSIKVNNDTYMNLIYEECDYKEINVNYLFIPLFIERKDYIRTAYVDKDIYFILNNRNSDLIWLDTEMKE